MSSNGIHQISPKEEWYETPIGKQVVEERRQRERDSSWDLIRNKRSVKFETDSNKATDGVDTATETAKEKSKSKGDVDDDDGMNMLGTERPVEETQDTKPKVSGKDQGVNGEK